jgi:hypothetical protein
MWSVDEKDLDWHTLARPTGSVFYDYRRRKYVVSHHRRYAFCLLVDGF